jgi:hypothetical protein
MILSTLLTFSLWLCVAASTTTPSHETRDTVGAPATLVLWMAPVTTINHKKKDCSQQHPCINFGELVEVLREVRDVPDHLFVHMVPGMHALVWISRLLI